MNESSSRREGGLILEKGDKFEILADKYLEKINDAWTEFLKDPKPSDSKLQHPGFQSHFFEYIRRYSYQLAEYQETLQFYIKRGDFQEVFNLFKDIGLTDLKTLKPFLDIFALEAIDNPPMPSKVVVNLFQDKSLEDLIEFKEVLAVYAKKGFTDEIFALIKDKSLEDLSAWEDVLIACAANGKQDEIFALIKDKSLEDLSAWEDVLVACAANGKQDEVFTLFEGRNLSNISKHEELLKILETCADNGKQKEVFALFDYITISHLDYTDIKLIDILSVCSKKGVHSQILTRLERIDFENLNPFKAILRNCAIYGSTDKVFELFRGKRLEELDGWQDVLVALVAYGKAEEIMEFFKGQKLEELPKYNWQGVLIRCIINGQAKKVFELFNLNETNLDKLSDWQQVLYYLADNGFEKEIFNLLRNQPLDQLNKWSYVLDACSFNGFKDEILSLIKNDSLEDYPMLRTRLENRTPELKKIKIIENIKKEHREIFEEEIKQDDLGTIEDFLDGLEFPELLFFDVVLRKQKFFNLRTLNIIKGKNYKAEIDKTNSKLFILKIDHQISIINEIPEKSAQIWEEVTKKDIPVAPFIRKKHNQQRKGYPRIVSRFCGIAFRHLDIKDKELREKIKADARKIVQYLSELNINHRQMHDGNFVLEFIDNNYLKNQRDAGHNINTIPWQEGKFNYDVEEYHRNPSTYTPIVRLIDFDMAERF
jgi:hypothetical protein